MADLKTVWQWQLEDKVPGNQVGVRLAAPAGRRESSNYRTDIR